MGGEHRPQFSQSSNPDITSVSNDSINLSLSSRTRRQEGKKSAGPASLPLFNPHPISEQQEAASGRWRREAFGCIPPPLAQTRHPDKNATSEYKVEKTDAVAAHKRVEPIKRSDSSNKRHLAAARLPLDFHKSPAEVITAIMSTLHLDRRLDETPTIKVQNEADATLSFLGSHSTAHEYFIG